MNHIALGFGAGATEGFGNFFILPVVLILAVVFFAPTILAYRRKHVYRLVILGLNIFAGWSGVGWLVAFVWAAWPSSKSFADPLLGNVTGLGRRTIGDTIGAAVYGVARGFTKEKTGDVAAPPLRSSKQPATRRSVDAVLSALLKRDSVL